jgi:hypothetical protein
VRKREKREKEREITRGNIGKDKDVKEREEDETKHHTNTLSYILA